MDLARELRQLGEHIEWPATPELRRAYEPRRSRGAVSLVFEPGGEPVLLDEFGYGPGFIKKIVGNAGGGVEWTDVHGAVAAWIPGPHDVYLPGAVPARLAGNVLVWERGRFTYRLEGRAL